MGHDCSLPGIESEGHRSRLRVRVGVSKDGHWFQSLIKGSWFFSFQKHPLFCCMFQSRKCVSVCSSPLMRSLIHILRRRRTLPPSSLHWRMKYLRSANLPSASLAGCVLSIPPTSCHSFGKCWSRFVNTSFHYCHRVVSTVTLCSCRHWLISISCTGCQHQGHVGSKTSLQQNPLYLCYIQLVSIGRLGITQRNSIRCWLDSMYVVFL